MVIPYRCLEGNKISEAILLKASGLDLRSVRHQADQFRHSCMPRNERSERKGSNRGGGWTHVERNGIFDTLLSMIGQDRNLIRLNYVIFMMSVRMSLNHFQD